MTQTPSTSLNSLPVLLPLEELLARENGVRSADELDDSKPGVVPSVVNAFGKGKEAKGKKAEGTSQTLSERRVEKCSRKKGDANALYYLQPYERCCADQFTV